MPKRTPEPMVIAVVNNDAVLHPQWTAHALAVLEGDVMGPVSAGFAGSFALVAPGRSVSAARALLELWTASAARRPERLAAAYETCLAVVVAAFHRDDWWNTERFLTLLLRQAAADLAELPGELLERLLDVCMAYVRDGERRVQPAAELRYWAEHVFGPGSLPHPEGLREQL